jgi:hypothetical protein
LVGKQGGFDKPFRAECQRADGDAATVAENGIGEDHYTFDLQQNCAVPEPRGVQSVVIPACGVRAMGSGENFPIEFLFVAVPKLGGETKRLCDHRFFDARSGPEGSNERS